MFKQLMASFLAFAYCLQVSVGVAKAQDKAWQLTPAFASTWNKVSQDWPKAHTGKNIEDYFKKLEMTFNPSFEQEDRVYAKTLLAQYDEFPEISKTEKGVLLQLKSNPNQRLEIVHVEGNTFLFNGKSFTYDSTKNFRSNFNAVDELFTAKTSFFEQVFYPKAYAIGVLGWILIGAGVLFAGYLIGKNSDKIVEKHKKVIKVVKEKHQEHKDQVHDAVSGDDD